MSREIELKDGQGVGIIQPEYPETVRPAIVKIYEGDLRSGLDFGIRGDVLREKDGVQLALPEFEQLIVEEVERRKLNQQRINDDYESDIRVQIEKTLNTHSLVSPQSSIPDINMMLSTLFFKLKIKRK